MLAARHHHHLTWTMQGLRTVLALGHDRADHSSEEIARRLKLGPKAAESLLTRARVAFRAAISELAGASDELTGSLGRSPG